MAKNTSIMLAVACTALASFTPAANAAPCAERAQVVEALTERFGEDLYGNAVSRTGEILEIYSNASSETWTILVTLPDRGLSCLVASGSGDQRLETQIANLED